MVTGQDIVDAARLLLGAPYDPWWPGRSLPQWLDLGYGTTPDSLPTAEEMKQQGTMCADLIDWAMCYNGFLYGGGVGGYASFLVNQQPFDPSSPGVPGAVALAPYLASDLYHQGHVALYTGEHTLIQALTFNGTAWPGVTEDYDDATTYSWGGDTEFTIYGFLPGVSYDAQPDKPASEPLLESAKAWGVYVFESDDSWNQVYVGKDTVAKWLS